MIHYLLKSLIYLSTLGCILISARFEIIRLLVVKSESVKREKDFLLVQILHQTNPIEVPGLDCSPEAKSALVVCWRK